MKKLLYTSALAIFLWQPTLASADTLDKQGALQKALQNNPTYKAALANVDEAEGSRLQASLLINPNATIDVENFSGKDGNEGFKAAELTFGIEQTIEIGGKRKNRIDVADYDYKISQQQANSQALSILAETEYAFIRVAIAQERIVLADKRLALADKTHEIVKRRIGTAKSPEIQHTKTDIEKAAANIEKRKAEKELLTSKNDLAQLLGMMDSSDLNVNADLGTLPKLVERQILIEALKETPQSQAQEFSKMQARASFDLARSEAIPDPTFGLGVRRFNESDSTALLASVSFPIPVFNRNQGEIQKAKANIVKANAQDDETKLVLQQSAIQSWESLASSLEEANRYQNDIIPSARKAYSQADDGYSRGAFNFLDLLDAQRTLYEVQEMHLDSLLSVYAAKVQTDFLMGTHLPMIEELSQANSKGKIND